MRVVAILPACAPRPVGSWLSTHECLRHLVERGHDVVAVAARTYEPGYTYEGVRVESGGMRGRAWMIDLAADADVVIAHSGGPDVATIAAARHGRPLVLMVHAFDSHDLTAAALVVCCSEAVRARVRPPAGTPTIVVRPPVARAVYEVDRSAGDRVTIVNLTDDKGVRTAWRVAERLPHIPFLAVRGGYGRQVEPRTANFEVVGPVPDMRQVYAATSVLLMPSRSETWGRVGVEAMCSGIPVVAHPSPGLREALGDAAIWVHRDNDKAWAAEVERLLDDREWYDDRSAAAEARARELDRVRGTDLERFEAALEQVVEGKVVAACV